LLLYGSRQKKKSAALLVRVTRDSLAQIIEVASGKKACRRAPQTAKRVIWGATRERFDVAHGGEPDGLAPV
jgi:hypothetical protein